MQTDLLIQDIIIVSDVSLFFYICALIQFFSNELFLVLSAEQVFYFSFTIIV